MVLPFQLTPTSSTWLEHFKHGLREDEVEVDFDEARYSRRLATQELEAEVERVWEARLKANPKLFDGRKFRFHSARELTVEKEGSNCSRIILQLGLTSYSQFLGTNLAGNEVVKAFEAAGRRLKGENASSQSCLSQPLGVGCLLLTSDRRFVFGRRSADVGECPGMFDVPGGHPEPDEAFKSVEGEKEGVGGGGAATAAATAATATAAESQRTRSALARRELFSSIAAEARDEFGVPLADLFPPVLLGFNANTATGGGRVSASFLIKTRLPVAKVGELYASAKEAFETVEMIAVEAKHAAPLAAALRLQLSGKGDAELSTLPSILVERSWAGSGKAVASSGRTKGFTKSGTLIHASEFTPSALATLCLYLDH